MNKNPSQTPVTITLTGAAGQIGYASLFRIAAGEMLGANTRIRLNLLDVPQALRAVEGVAMELADCAFDLVDSINIYDDPQQAFDGANIGMLIGARPRSQGMERGDLLAANAGIFSVQGEAINNGATDDVKILVVGNPANTNAMICASHAPDVPVQRFTALTRLDHNRAVTQLAQTAETTPSEIEGVSIWGNHSATQYPCVTHASIAGKPALEVLQAHGKDEAWIMNTLVPRVAKRGAEIIDVRGGSSVGSAAYAAVQHIKMWTSEEQQPTSMGVATDGSYGVEPGLICSFPVTAGDGQFHIAQGIQLTEAGQKHFEASVQELRDEKETVRSMGLLGERQW